MSTNDSASPRNWVAPHVEALPRSGIRAFFELVTTMKDVLSLGVGEPDFVTPWGIREATINALDQGRTAYTSSLGLLPLRKAIGQYAAREFGVEYDPHLECLVTVGVSEAIDLILRAVLSPGDEVLYHEPCFVAYAPGIAMTHAVPVPVRCHEADRFALEPAAVERAITPRTKALLLNFPCNPTGANLSLPAREALAAVACRHDLFVISDEIYTELTYGERPPSIAALPGMKERTMLLAGFSKAFAMTGYRIGYACGPQSVIAAMTKIHQYTMLCASGLAQEAALEALRHGARARDAMAAEYRQRRNVIVRRLNEMGLPCVMPEGAFYVFPNISSTGLGADEFARRFLQEERVAVVPGTAFCRDGGQYVRCAYAVSMETIVEAMQRLERFVGRLRSARAAGASAAPGTTTQPAAAPQPLSTVTAS